MKLDLVKQGSEYYFYFINFFITGFVINVSDNLIHIKNGVMYCSNYGATEYGEGFLDCSQIVGFAST